jgi:hypothetical protein
VKSIQEAAASVPGESSVEVTNSTEMHADGTPANVSVKMEIVPEAPAKRRPGRPKKVVEAAAPAPVVPELVNEPVENTKVSADPVQGRDPEEFVEVLAEPDFVVSEKQDDESTFLIDPEGVAPTPTPAPAKPEFSFDVDEDEAPPPPPIRQSVPQNLGFEVEEDETPAPAPAAVKPEPIVTPLNTEDFGDVEPGLFDE